MVVVALGIVLTSGCDTTTTDKPPLVENPYEWVAEQQYEALSFTTEYVQARLDSPTYSKTAGGGARLTKEAFFEWARGQGWDEEVLSRTWGVIEQEQKNTADLAPREAAQRTLDASELNDAQKEYILRMGDAAQASSTLEQLEAAVREIEEEAYSNLDEGKYDIVLVAAASVKGMARHWAESGKSFQAPQQVSASQMVARIDNTRTSDPYCERLPSNATFDVGAAIWRGFQGVGIGCGVGATIGAASTWWTGPGAVGGAGTGCAIGGIGGLLTGVGTYTASYRHALNQWCYYCRGQSDLATRSCPAREPQD